MASTRSRLTNFIVRILCRFFLGPNKSVTEVRDSIARFNRFSKGKTGQGIDLEEIDDPVKGRWLHNTANDSGKVILYLHGGAFILRIPDAHSAMVSRLCKHLGASAFLPWYRLAPEHRFPAAPDDCLAAYQYLLERYSPENIFIMGDSAGGNLTLVMLNYIKQKQLPMPRAAVALSPITDFLQISSTWLMHTWHEPLFVIHPATSPQRYYLNEADLTHPLASPIYADLSGLPPVLLVAGGVEALRDDSVSYVREAIEDGVDAQVHIWEGQPHVHQLMDFLPEAKLAEQELFKWLESLPPLGTPVDKDKAWRKAVTLFNRRAVVGTLNRMTNGEQVDNLIRWGEKVEK